MGKIILTLIIALGVTLISKEDEYINLFFLAISMIMLLYYAFQQHKAKKHGMGFIAYLRHTPLCHDGLLECYVKVCGSVITPDTQTLPYVTDNKTYSFFVSKVFGVWQDKRKKPQKGFATAKKSLHQTLSSDVVTVQMNDLIIHFDPQDFLVDGVQLLSQKKQVFTESPLAESSYQPPLSRHYESYQLITQMANAGDYVTLFGCLTKKDGKLYLTNKHLPNYPSIIAQGKPEVIYQYYQANLDKKYKNIRYIKWIFMVQIALLLWIVWSWCAF